MRKRRHLSSFNIFFIILKYKIQNKIFKDLGFMFEYFNFEIEHFLVEQISYLNQTNIIIL